MTNVQVARIRVDAAEDWSPPLGLHLGEGFRQVSEYEALRHPRPHLIEVRGGRYVGYTEWWVADVECGCPEH